MKKRLLFSCVLVFAFSIYQTSIAGEPKPWVKHLPELIKQGWEHVITSETLKAEDLYNAIQRITIQEINILGGGKYYRPSGRIEGSVGILGVHQEGNKATIYCDYMIREQNNKRIPSLVKVIRFNSGGWFSPLDNMFLSK